MSLNEDLREIEIARLRNAIEKKAGAWFSFKEAVTGKMGKQMTEAMIAAGAGAAITTIGTVGKAGFEVIRERMEKPKAFKNMMENMPGLKREDPKAVQMTYNTLYGLNRQMAKDPLVAGSFVSRNINRAETGGEGGAYVDPQTAKTLMDAGSKSNRSPIFESWAGGAQNRGPSAADENLQKLKIQELQDRITKYQSQLGPKK